MKKWTEGKSKESIEERELRSKGGEEWRKKTEERKKRREGD